MICSALDTTMFLAAYYLPLSTRLWMLAVVLALAISFVLPLGLSGLYSRWITALVSGT